MIEPPIDAKIDLAAAIVKGAISNVPLAGGLMAELGNLYFNPLERRKQRWMSEVSTALNLIHERFAMSPADLERDDRFTSFLFEATTVAIKTHQTAKLEALRNSLAKSVRGAQLNEDIGIQFLRYIDELTPSHLMLLSTLERDILQYANFTSLKEVCSAISNEIENALDDGAIRVFLQDLDARFLLRLGDLDELPEFATKKSFELREESAVRPIEVTALGRSFLAFIDP